MIKLFCDECGEEIDTVKFAHFKVKVECTPGTMYGDQTAPIEKDLCEYCGRVLIGIMKGEKK